MENQLLTCRETCTAFGGVDPSTLYRGIRLGRYPRPIKVGPGSSRWLRSEIDACLRQMVEGRSHA
jgi:predicted DNA-binding transcriptional regulator AlpA